MHPIALRMSPDGQPLSMEGMSGERSRAYSGNLILLSAILLFLNPCPQNCHLVVDVWKYLPNGNLLLWFPVGDWLINNCFV